MSAGEHPIIFSGPMATAILRGEKTQTRRVVKGQALEWLAPDMFTPEYVAHPENGLCPYGQHGDRLWVRESFSSDWILHQLPPREWPHGAPVHYWADGNPEYGDWTPPKPPIHMPRWASRLTLEIVSVRVERLQDISEGDAIAEGWEGGAAGNPGNGGPFDWFRGTWDSINAKRGHGWDTNPFVWVVTFKQVTP